MTAGGAARQWRRLIAAGRRLVGRLRGSRPGRALRRFTEERGNLLTGGIAYAALMSLAAAVVVGSTVLALVVGNAPGMRDAVLRFLGRAVPGLAGTEDALIDESALSASPVTGVVSAVALLVGLNTASRYVAALRGATQSMLGTESRSAVRGKARDLAALAALGSLAIVAAVAQVAAGTVLAWLGAPDDYRVALVGAAAAIISLAADLVFVMVVYRVLGGARDSWRRLLAVGAVVAGGIGALRLGSALLLGAAVSNPVLAPFAAVVAVLVWVDAVSRLVLLGAAWLGTGEEASAPVGAERP